MSETAAQQVKIVMIFRNTNMTRLFQDTGFFQPGKVISTIQVMSVEVAGVPFTDQQYAELVASATTAAKESGHDPIAAFVPGVAAGAWADANVKVLSSGRHFARFGEVLKAYGYAGEYTYKSEAEPRNS